MSLAPINTKLVALALAEVEPASFERFGQVFYGSLLGRAFVPLGGVNDGGAKGFLEPELFIDATVRHFLQVSKQKTYDQKIKQTIKRLREVGRDPLSLTYITSETVLRIDPEEEKLSSELQCAIRIRDAKYVEAQINASDASIASFNTYLLPTLDYLSTPRAVGISPRAQIYTDRTLAVFLGQEVEHRRGKTDLLVSVADASIIWALSDTNPDDGKLMNHEQLLERIESTLPSARQFIRGVLDDRLLRLSSKGTNEGCRIRSYRTQQAYCLPFETREAVKRENVEDGALRVSVTGIFQRRLETFLSEG